jgi:hypothetical protein
VKNTEIIEKQQAKTKMSKEEVIELLESLKGDTSGHMQSIPETIWEGIFNERIDEVIKELDQNKDDE